MPQTLCSLSQMVFGKAYICNIKKGGEECGRFIHPDSVFDKRGRRTPANLRSHLNDRHPSWNREVGAQKRVSEFPSKMLDKRILK